MTPDPEAFRALFAEQGEPILWFPAIPCTCYRAGNNDYTFSCPLNCQHGYLYSQQTVAANGQTLSTVDASGLPTDGPRAVIQMKKTELVNTSSGMFQGFGDGTIMTMADEIPLARPDMYVRLTVREQYRETLQRGVADKLTHPYAFQILALVGTTGTRLTEGKDYRLDTATNSVVWLSNAVAENGKYSLAYYYRPRFWFLGVLDKSARPAPSGGLLADRGVITVRHPSTFNG
jgi:hypothetical protein